MFQTPTHATPRRVKATPASDVDVAIVGSGLGGLMAGALLARQGLRVALFDHHYVAGGCATMFRRGRHGQRWTFDVGMHYVGDGGPGGRVPALFEAAGAELSLQGLDASGYDRVHVPGLTTQVPWTVAAYRDRLVAAFPSERDGIDRYIRVLRHVSRVSEASLKAHGRVSWRVIWTVLRHAQSVLRWQHATAHDVIASCTQNPVLRATLLGLHGCYGVGPRRVSAMMHFGLCAHFMRGGYYPRGGGQRLADSLADAVEAHGGQVCLRRGIEEILVRGGRAVGVRTDRGEEVTARVVLSNACIRKTLLELVPADALPASVVTRAEAWEMAVSIHLLSLGVQGDIRSYGVRPGNEWITDDLDIDGIYARIRRGEQRPETMYVTSGSVKDALGGHHAPPGHGTLQLMTFVSGKPEHWGVDEASIRRGTYRDLPEYQRRKRALDDALLARIGRLWPALTPHVVFQESATPLTHARYTRSQDGTAYGLSATVGQFLAKRPGAEGPLPGLYHCGASTRSAHGIIGSLNSGYVAALAVGRALGCRLPPLQGWTPGRVVTPDETEPAMA